jgi:hypothetical protein
VLPQKPGTMSGKAAARSEIRPLVLIPKRWVAGVRRRTRSPIGMPGSEDVTGHEGLPWNRDTKVCRQSAGVHYSRRVTLRPRMLSVVISRAGSRRNSRPDSSLYIHSADVRSNITYTCLPWWILPT